MTKLGKDYPELGTETWSGVGSVYTTGSCITDKDMFHYMHIIPEIQLPPDDDDDDPELDELVKA